MKPVGDWSSNWRQAKTKEGGDISLTSFGN